MPSAGATVGGAAAAAPAAPAAVAAAALFLVLTNSGRADGLTCYNVKDRLQAAEFRK